MTRIEELEQLKMELFSNIHPEVKEELPPLDEDTLYLYHGIRFGSYKEQLETAKLILKQGILPKNQLSGQSFYSENCNDGKRVSLLEKKDFEELEFKTFVAPNISIIVSPLIEAYKTIYVPYEEWIELSEQQNLHNFYSYARNEYQVNGIVPVSMIKAIGVPCSGMIMQRENPRMYVTELSSFCENLGLHIPIVDHTVYNQYVYKK